MSSRTLLGVHVYDKYGKLFSANFLCRQDGVICDLVWKGSLLRNAIGAFNVENAKPEEAALD